MLKIIMSSLRSLKRRIDARYYRFCVDHCPKKIIEKSWLKDFGYPIDWEHPRDINEKIQWLIAFSDTREWSRLSDKYLVRDYVASKGYGDHLTKLYGVWKRAEDIDFDTLPDKFVLKCNHDCGSYCIVDNKKGYDKYALVKKMNACLKRKYGFYYCEPHYNRIKSLIIAEEFLENDTSFSTSLVDYKVWCFDGKPYSVLVCYNRSQNGKYANFCDLDWNVHPEWSVFSERNKDGGGRVPKPACFSEMLEMASVLSKGFPEVRVDFYVVKNKVYFGEMTFTASAGRNMYYSPWLLKELGNQCDLALAKRIR